MQVTPFIAKHIRDVYFGGNWTFVNLKDTLQDITWEQATQKVASFNTIATLVYHIGYFVTAATQVLEGNPLDAHDKYSFSHPPIQSPEDWENFVQKTFDDAEKFAALVEALPANKLEADFWDSKYGNYYRNLHGIIEHMHYHLGQIVFLKKIIQNS